jgi:hypothetical protein
MQEITRQELLCQRACAKKNQPEVLGEENGDGSLDGGLGFDYPYCGDSHEVDLCGI